MEIFVEQELSTHQEMAIFGQFTESRIKVVVSDENGDKKELGVVEQLYPKGAGYRLKLNLGKRPGKRTQGFTFTNLDGTWFLTRPS